MSKFFKKTALILLTVSCCSFISPNSVRAQNVVNLNSFDDVELQQYFLIFVQQRDTLISSSCQALPENYCKVLILQWKQRENQLENYMIQRGVGIPEHEELPDV